MATDSKKQKLMKAYEILRHSNIFVVIISGHGVERPMLQMVIDKETHVSYNFKGWVCDHKHISKKRTEGSRPREWTCALNKGVICKHIIACQLYLKKNKLTRDWMDKKDFQYTLN